MRAVMFLQGPIVIVAEKPVDGMIQAFTDAGAYPVVETRWTEAPSAIDEIKPSAVVIADSDGGALGLVHALTQRFANAGPYLPVVMRVCDKHVAPLRDVLPISAEAPIGQMIARLSSAIRLRSLHATVIGRAKALAEERDIDDERRAVQLLRRTEQLPLEGVGDHDVVANFDGEHCLRPFSGGIARDHRRVRRWRQCWLASTPVIQRVLHTSRNGPADSGRNNRPSIPHRCRQPLRARREQIRQRARQILERDLVGTAVLRSAQRANAAAHRGVHVRTRAGHDAAGERGGVVLVLCVQVQRGMHRLHPQVGGRLAVQQMQERAEKDGEK